MTYLEMANNCANEGARAKRVFTNLARLGVGICIFCSLVAITSAFLELWPLVAISSVGAIAFGLFAKGVYGDARMFHRRWMEMRQERLDWHFKYERGDF